MLTCTYFNSPNYFTVIPTLIAGVYMEGCVLKSNIVNPGKACPKSYTVEEIAQVSNYCTLLQW